MPYSGAVNLLENESVMGSVFDIVERIDLFGSGWGLTLPIIFFIFGLVLAFGLNRENQRLGLMFFLIMASVILGATGQYFAWSRGIIGIIVVCIILSIIPVFFKYYKKGTPEYDATVKGINLVKLAKAKLDVAKARYEFNRSVRRNIEKQKRADWDEWNRNNPSVKFYK